MFMKSRWLQNDEAVLSADNLEALLNNQIPAIRIPGFASEEECAMLLKAIEENGFQHYENTIPPIGRIGITQFEFRELSGEGKRPYFDRAKESITVRDELCKRSFNYLQRVIDALAAVRTAPVGIANEGGPFGEYFAGLVRQINKCALIHSDFACFDAPDWKIGRILSQLSFNIYVQTPDSGGEAVVHNKQWNLSHERQRMTNSYGYERALVEGVESVELKQKTGDLVLFNTRNFHEVRQAVGNRVTVSSFIGQLEDDSLILWS